MNISTSLNARKTLLSVFTLATLGASAQCTALTLATSSGDTLHNTIAGYHSSVAYNPDANTYYSANPGGGTANESFDASGQSIGTSLAVDYRGIWYNPSTQLIEGNGWGGGLVENNLSTNGKLGTTSSYIFNAQMPETQSVGAFNSADTIVYYYSFNKFYEFKRTVTGVTGPVVITGISDFTSISTKTIIYTGCLNKELGIYDFGAKQLHLINEATGALETSIALPSTAPNPNGLWGVSYANNILWLYDTTNNKWVGFNIFDNNVTINEAKNELSLSIYPNPTTGKVTFSATEQISSIEIYNLTGQKVATFNNTKTIDISNLPNGIYTARVNSKNGNSTKKLIKE